MEKEYTVYIHTNKINGKKYIGQTGQDPERRWRNGKGYTKKKHEHFFYAIKKYGWDNFSHEIIEGNLSSSKADNLEIYLINKYKTTERELGYNYSLGGKASKQKFTDKTKKIISEKAKERYHSRPDLQEIAKRPMSEESRKKLSDSRKKLNLKKRIIKRCEICGTEFEVVPSKLLVSCPKESCKKEVILRAAKTARNQNEFRKEIRNNKIKEKILNWSKENRDLILNCPLNNIKPIETEILKIIEPYGLKDMRAASVIFLNEQGKINLIRYLRTIL